MANQFRNYILTINNPEQTDEQFNEYLKTLDHLKYFIFQREKGEKEGTEHFQIYIEFNQGKRFDKMKNDFPKAHIENRKGSKTQARDYCSKEDTRVGQVFEFGEFAEERERTDLTDILNMIENGSTDKEICDAYPSQYFRYYNNISHIRQSYLESKFQDTFRTLEVNYIYGSAGVGKTRYVMEKYGYSKVFRVTTYDKNCFDDYKSQDVIVFEEFRGLFKISDMLNYLDGYPLMLSSRYNNKVACFTKVYIITNLPLDEQYKNIQEDYPSTWKAFLRRITNIYNFDIDKEKPINKLSVQQLILREVKDGSLPF